MKYKVGDRVKIKNDENFCEGAERDFNNLINRIGIIKKVELEDSISYYLLEGLKWAIPENHIECLEKEDKEIQFRVKEKEYLSRKKVSRFEIMDI